MNLWTILVVLCACCPLTSVALEQSFSQDAVIPPGLEGSVMSSYACPDVSSAEGVLPGTLDSFAAAWRVAGLDNTFVLGDNPNQPKVKITSQRRKGNAAIVWLWNGSHLTLYPRDVILTIDLVCSYPQ